MRKKTIPLIPQSKAVYYVLAKKVFDIIGLSVAVGQIMRYVF
ncbi:MAG: hypothetical protein PHY41_02290 [Candidatus Cloacimonetes bacterium]|jgi:hypothetical protein|nr:hypothetical protein [Candidatus Cloacimonadota bacterium]MDD3282299.1 hypothetical protein [Candidatus Cloacimonadota bacterium]MDD4687752.1 hypothetical protein [Candidatus Cloacimonadota bacterium]MDY0299568.1 hypothetical protein [Candidatus Cloacimonadaceae bacterium]